MRTTIWLSSSALIASTVPAAANSLTTGTLTYSDIQSAARYNASQTWFGLGWRAGAKNSGQGQVVTIGMA